MTCGVSQTLYIYDVCLANRSNIQLLGSTGSNLCSVLSLHGVVFLCFFVFYCIALHGFCVLLYVIAWHIKAQYCVFLCYCVVLSVFVCYSMVLCFVLQHVIVSYCIYVTVFVVFYVISCYCVLLYSLCFMMYHAIVWQQCVDYRPRPNIPLKIVQILFAQNSRKYKA